MTSEHRASLQRACMPRRGHWPDARLDDPGAGSAGSAALRLCLARRRVTCRAGVDPGVPVDGTRDAGPSRRTGDRCQMPIWVWCQWRGVSRRRPDLRSRGHLPTGATGVRIELELDEERVLCSDFDLWHYALNGWYLPESLADEREFDAHPDRGRIAPSWRRMFNLEWRNRRYTAARAAKSIQGVTWELRPQDVRRSTSFVAR